MTDAQTETRFHEIRVKQGEGESQAGPAAALPQQGHRHTCPKPFPGCSGHLGLWGLPAGTGTCSSLWAPGSGQWPQLLGLRGLVVAHVLWRGAEKPHPPGSPRVPRMSAQPTTQGQGPSWGAADTWALQLTQRCSAPQVGGSELGCLGADIAHGARGACRARRPW